MEYQDSIPESLEPVAFSGAPQTDQTAQEKQIVFVSCSRCNHFNEEGYNFCTNCGFYLKEDKKTIFQLRNKLRLELLKKCEHQVITTRVILFIVSVFFLSGIAFLFGNLDERFVLTIVSLILSALFFVFAVFSYYKPFTSFLSAFVVILTFSVISIFAEFTNSVILIPDLGYEAIFSIYNIVIVMVLIYFMLRGIQGSYKADIIKEEIHFSDGTRE